MGELPENFCTWFEFFHPGSESWLFFLQIDPIALFCMEKVCQQKGIQPQSK
jgi:hypothetical protein